MANLLYQTAFIGDLLLSIPLILRIQHLYPGEELHLVCRQGFASFFEETGLVDRAFEVKKGAGRAPYKELISQLGEREYDKVWCPHQSFRTTLVMKQLRAKERVGFWTAWNAWAFEKRVKREMSWPDSLRQLSLLSPHDPSLAEQLSRLEGMENPEAKEVWNASLAPEVPEWCSMNLMAPGALSEQAANKLDTLSDSLLGQHKLTKFEYALIFPGSVWATQRWTLEGYTEVARSMLGEGWGVILMGTGGETEICQQIASQVEGVIDLSAKTSLFEALALMSQAKIVVSNDSGAAHLASCARAPLVSIFGPTTLSLGYRPWQSQAVVMQKDLPCRPCGKHGSQRCPIETFECMKAITADEVLASVRLLTL